MALHATQRVSPNFPRKQLPKPERANPFCPRLWEPTPQQGAHGRPLIVPRLRTPCMSFQVHPSTSPRNLCQGLQIRKWMDFSVPLPAFKFVHHSSLELGCLDTRLGTGEEPVQVLLHRLWTVSPSRGLVRLAHWSHKWEVTTLPHCLLSGLLLITKRAYVAQRDSTNRTKSKLSSTWKRKLWASPKPTN